MKQSIVLVCAVLLLSFYLITAAGPKTDKAEEQSDIDQARIPRDPSDRLWRVTSEDTLSLEVAASENSTGAIRLIRSGQVIASWRTGFPTRQFGVPLVMGPYPEQVIIVPFEVGGGTGVGGYDWVSIRRTKGGVFWKHMGLWATWSHGKHDYSFSMGPCLLGSGKNLLFEFRYSRRTEDGTKAVGGRLKLEVRGKEHPTLAPVALQDAMALVQLLDSPLVAVRAWGGKVVQQCLPKDIGLPLSRKGWKVDDADRKLMTDALSSYFASKREKQ